MKTEAELDAMRSIKLANAAYLNPQYNIGTDNPWATEDVDKLESPDHDKYKTTVQACRFFYRRDPLASTIINKLVDIGISELHIEGHNLSENQLRIFEGIKDEMHSFAEDMALEYLTTGLIVPEVKYAVVTDRNLKRLGIKKRTGLILPVSMWLRDSGTIKINQSFIMNKPSYFVEVPEELIFFIMNEGQYMDGTKDIKLYNELKSLYPDFVRLVKEGEKEILIENDLIVRRRALPDSPYPMPYLYPAIEPLKHKRNLRRMDYSIAARVISAILLTKLGNDEFPILEEDEDQFDTIKSQMRWRYTGDRDVERIFQLFANHTLEMEWIYPPVDALLDDAKYDDINQDIVFALGFPRVLITGENQKSGTGSSELAMISPVKTMESFRLKILRILNNIADQIITKNDLRGSVDIRFEPINLHNFADFVEGLVQLYETGNLSRQSFAKAFGYNIEEELNLRSKEKEEMEKLGIDDFAPRPFSPQPGQPNQPNNTQ